MRCPVLSSLAVAIVAMGLSACASKPLVSSPEPFRVAAVKIEMRDGVGSPHLVQRLDEATRREAALYDRGGRGKEMRIQVNNVSYKNAGTALLGIRSSLSAEVAVVDVATGRSDAAFYVFAEDGKGGVGTISRVVNAVSIDPAKDDEALAQTFAAKALEKIYGSDAAFAVRIGKPIDPVVVTAAANPSEPEPAPAPTR